MTKVKWTNKEKVISLIVLAVILLASSLISINNNGKFNLFHTTGLTMSLAFNAFLFAIVIKLTGDK